MMPTVLREGGLRVIIYTTDHAPPHVHVFGDGETKIGLGDGANASEVIRRVDATIAESRRALRIVRGSHAYLMRCWTDLHG
ncbi:DUF4160 domain-containing protein [Sphingomonas profundi]|uniref:DUF4160 domain-containing protein n=1 Tax=Alterirhizorhabdus profundi TaxID=2681549 RepID=UPI001E453C4D|nr:DUF4160 domain-containing protein [Sphingomonas profundi]